MDFYTDTSARLDKLSGTERNVFNFVIKNMHRVKDMSIRELAAECYVSTTTLFRLVKKLGFEGYSEFVAAIRDTEADSRRIDIPDVVFGADYQSSYLKNITEAVQVITPEKKEAFDRIMSRYPKIYILAQGLSQDVGWYFYRMLTTCGYEVEFPEQEYQFKAILRRIKRDDVLLVLSYTGNNQAVIRQIEEIFAIATPTIISLPALPHSEPRAGSEPRTQPQDHSKAPLPEVGVSGSPPSSTGTSLGLLASWRLLCCSAEGSEHTGQQWGGSSGAGAHLQQHLAGLQLDGYISVGTLQVLKGVPGLGVALGAESS